MPGYCQDSAVCQKQRCVVVHPEHGAGSGEVALWTMDANGGETAKKQAQSGNAGGRRQEEGIDTGTCTLCGRVEDTAHILTDCNAYSYRLWERFGELLTATHRKVNPDTPRVSLTCNKGLIPAKFVKLGHKNQLLIITS